jgi:hypothetical protein
MDYLTTPIALPSNEISEGLPVVEAIPLEEYQRPSTPLVPTPPPTVRCSTRQITMAPDNPDKWPKHCLKRELIELKKTVDVLELWTWFQVESPPEGDGYMLWDHENMNKISDKLGELYGNQHSGFTWGMSLRTIQFIAKNGFDNWKKEIDKLNREKNK